MKWDKAAYARISSNINKNRGWNHLTYIFDICFWTIDSFSRLIHPISTIQTFRLASIRYWLDCSISKWCCWRKILFLFLLFGLFVCVCVFDINCIKSRKKLVPPIGHTCTHTKQNAHAAEIGLTEFETVGFIYKYVEHKSPARHMSPSDAWNHL